METPLIVQEAKESGSRQDLSGGRIDPSRSDGGRTRCRPPSSSTFLGLQTRTQPSPLQRHKTKRVSTISSSSFPERWGRCMRRTGWRRAKRARRAARSAWAQKTRGRRFDDDGEKTAHPGRFGDRRLGRYHLRWLRGEGRATETDEDAVRRGPSGVDGRRARGDGGKGVGLTEHSASLLDVSSRRGPGNSGLEDGRNLRGSCEKTITGVGGGWEGRATSDACEGRLRWVTGRWLAECDSPGLAVAYDLATTGASDATRDRIWDSMTTIAAGEREAVEEGGRGDEGTRRDGEGSALGRPRLRPHQRPLTRPRGVICMDVYVPTRRLRPWKRS